MICSLKHFLTGLYLFFATGFLFAQTNISGTISSNTIWTKANSPYIITDTTTVATSALLTVEPGTEIIINVPNQLIINGSIKAIGTIGDSITFTCDTNTKYEQDRIILNSGMSEFKLCTFRLDYGNLNQAKTGTYIFKSCYFQNTYLKGSKSSVLKIDSCFYSLEDKNPPFWSIQHFGFARMTNTVFSGKSINLGAVYAYNCTFCNI